MKWPSPVDLAEERAARELARALEEGTDADPEALEAVDLLRRAGGSEPSADDLRRLGDELFPPRRRRWPVPAAAAAMIIVAGAAALLLRAAPDADPDPGAAHVHARAERVVAALQRADSPAARAQAIAEAARGER